MAVRLGLTFPLLSDPAMRVIRAYGIGDNVPHITGILEKLKAEG
jgi:peroxiredoxin